MEHRKKILFNDIIAASTTVKDDAGNPAFKYVNGWNSQIDEVIQTAKPNNGYPFKTPAVFLEFIPGDSQALLMGVSSYPNAIIRFHIAHQLLNKPGGKMDLNLDVTDYADYLKAAFVKKKPPFCSGLTVIEDMLDYDHNSLYKYILGFKTNYIETKGSILDVDSGAGWSLLSNPKIAQAAQHPFYLARSGEYYMGADGKKYRFNLRS